MTKKMTFPLPGGKYIRKYDNRNWCVCSQKKRKDGSLTELMETYHPTLKGAWRSSVNSAVLSVETKSELVDIIKQLEQLKHFIYDE